MDLFKTLNSILPANGQATICIVKVNDEMMKVMTSFPSSVEEMKTIPPFVVSASPKELDEKFVEEITTPASEICQMSTNLEQIKKALKEAEKNATKKSTPSSKESDKQKELAEKRKKDLETYNNLTEEAEKAIKEGKNKKALSLLQEARKMANVTVALHSKDVDILDRKIKGLQDQVNTPSMFDVEEPEEKPSGELEENIAQQEEMSSIDDEEISDELPEDEDTDN